ncbi:MAG TPA: hypothetical protein VIC25_09185 [Caulobacteraceae bacterium]
MKIIAAALAASAAVALAVAGPASALTNLVTNGGFETNGGGGQINFNTFATGWTVGGTKNNSYTFLYKAGSSDRLTGANKAPSGVSGQVALWGPNDGSANFLPASSPQGGYFLAQDGDYPGHTSAVQQTISGLQPGKEYLLTFDYGFAQQHGFDGKTVQDWQVSLGSETWKTTSYDLGNHGFSGWLQGQFEFTASNASEVLSFLAQGNKPLPPFALLDNVSLSMVLPEPSDWVLMLAGFAVIGAAARTRRARGLIAKA